MARLSTWKIAGLLAAASVSTVSALGLWIHFGIQAQWEALVRQVDETLDRVNSRPSRPFAGTVPGNAWEDYLAAAAEFEIKARSGLAEEPRTAGWEGRLSRLLQGTRRAASRFPFPVAERRGYQLPAAMQYAANSARLIGVPWAKSLFEQGRRREAIDLLLDQATFGIDLWDRGFETDVMDGYFVVLQSFEALQVLLPRTLGKDDLLHVLRRLEQLDASWPNHQLSIQTDLLALGMLLIREDRADDVRHTFGGYERVRREWRTFYSSRLHAVRQFRKVEAILQRVSDAERLPIESAHPLVFGIHQESQSSRDPLFTMSYHVIHGTSSRTVRAKGRLMQMAARYLANGDIVELEDPMGGKLRVLKSPERTVFRRTSAGSEAATSFGPEDLVLEADRK